MYVHIAQIKCFWESEISPRREVEASITQIESGLDAVPPRIRDKTSIYSLRNRRELDAKTLRVRHQNQVQILFGFATD